MDSNLLFEKLRENVSKPDRFESDNTMVKLIVDEILGTRCITKKKYKGMCEQIGLDNYFFNRALNGFVYKKVIIFMRLTKEKLLFDRN